MKNQKKWELSENTKVKNGRTLTQIRALISFDDVEKGDLGGWIEDGGYLDSKAWMYEKAELYKYGKIFGGVVRGGEIHGGEIKDGDIVR